MSVIPFEPRTYRAKLIEVPTGFGDFKLAGTLDGHIDFAIPQGKTYPFSLMEAKLLIAALNSAVTDVEANCLYDRDSLLMPD